MDAKKIYRKLEEDFIEPEIEDDWTEVIEPISEFVTDEYKKRSMGLLSDNTKEIKEVYTAVFPSDKVMKTVTNKSSGKTLLFLHHPAVWDLTNAPDVFRLMNKAYLKKFRETGISIYNLHHPLDNYSEYSTGKTLTEKLDMKPIEPFAELSGVLCGVIARTSCNNIQDIQEKFTSAIGHKTSLYDYGSNKIEEGRIAVVGGGGVQEPIVKAVAENDLGVLLTGVTDLNDHSRKAHEIAEENGINLLGGTHYSTEKFACRKMCEYFRKMGLKAEFLEEEPDLADL